MAMTLACTDSLIGAGTRHPLLPEGIDVAGAFVHILNNQGARMLEQAARINPKGADPEAVHQTRVALRRMRSALVVFRPATDSDATRDLATSLRGLGHLLGPARAWDVFLTEAGARIAEAFPDHPGIASLLRAGRRHHQRAYAALARDLAGAHFTELKQRLASVTEEQGWIDTLDASQRARLHAPLDQFGAETLERQHKRVRRAGRNLRQLDTPRLHVLRLRAKRLRYAAEFFSSQFPGKPAKRYLRRLAALQEELGWLNDAAATAALMAGLGARGQAGGIVLGYVAAEAAAARERIPKTWTHFRRAAPFWTAALAPVRVEPSAEI